MRTDANLKADYRRRSDVWTAVFIAYLVLIVLALLSGLWIWTGIDVALAAYAGWKAKHYADLWASTSIDK